MPTKKIRFKSEKFILLILSLFLVCRGNAENTEYKKMIQLNGDGIYSLTSGREPCTETYVGWTEDNNKVSFMLGRKIVFQNFNEGLRKRNNSDSETDEICIFTSKTILKKNFISRESKVDCGQKVQRNESVKFSESKIEYELNIQANGKDDQLIKCIYELEKR